MAKPQSPLPPLGEIQDKSRRAQVLDFLRDAILHGDLKPGQPLTETELAAQFGISRAPLREALQILNAEGLVESLPYRGTTVRQLTREDIEELYSLRTILETFAIQRIIEFGSAEDIAALRQLYEHMLTVAQQGNVKLVSEEDRRFHDTVIEFSRHKLLIAVWHGVGMRVRQVMALRNKQNRDIVQIARNHLPLIEALERRDIETASSAIKRHIESAADLLIEQWPPTEDAADDENSDGRSSAGNGRS